MEVNQIQLCFKPKFQSKFQEIVGHIQDNFPYYAKKGTWIRSIRANLSRSHAFVKLGNKVWGLAKDVLSREVTQVSKSGTDVEVTGFRNFKQVYIVV